MSEINEKKNTQNKTQHSFGSVFTLKIEISVSPAYEKPFLVAYWLLKYCHWNDLTVRFSFIIHLVIWLKKHSLSVYDTSFIRCQKHKKCASCFYVTGTVPSDVYFSNRNVYILL